MERRFIAERKIKILGVFLFWWPVINFEWRSTQEAAMRDIEHDAHIREPLVVSKIYESN